MLMGVEHRIDYARNAQPRVAGFASGAGSLGDNRTAGNAHRTVGDIAERAIASGFEAPAVAVFGNVVALRENLNWYENRPLSGKRIVVTRTRKQASVLSNKLRALGAQVVELPTIRIEPPTDLREFAELVQDAHIYDWIVFTSANGVEAFFEIFQAIRRRS